MSTLLTSPQQRTTERPLVQVTNDEVQAQASNDQYHVEVDDAKVSTQEFDDVEVELNTKTLWIQKDKLGVRAYAPPVIAYKRAEENEWFEVRNWNLKIDVSAAGWATLPDQMARHFFKYFSLAQESGLSDKDQLDFASICREVDYRTFCAEFAPTRYMECTLVRKHPEPRLRSSSGKDYKLTPALVDSLHILKDGDYFGAEFTFSPSGVITAIASPRLLTQPDISEIDRLLPQRK